MSPLSEQAISHLVWTTIALVVAALTGIGIILYLIRKRITQRQIVTCPACGGVGTLRIQGAGKTFDRHEEHLGLLCTRPLAEDLSGRCGFVFSSSLCRLPRLRFVLLASSCSGGPTLGTTLCRGIAADSNSTGIRFEFIITPRADQLNASEIDIPGREIYRETLDGTETPTAVRGVQNNCPLVMTCQIRARWGRSTALVTLSPWDLERWYWEAADRDRTNSEAGRPNADGYLLLLDSGEDVERQLQCLDDLEAMLRTAGGGRGVKPIEAPIAVAVTSDETAMTEHETFGEMQDIVETRLAAVFNARPVWYRVPEHCVRMVDYPASNRRTAFDLSQPLSWLLSRNGLRTSRPTRLDRARRSIETA